MLPPNNTEPLCRSLPLYKDLGFAVRPESERYDQNLTINGPHPGLVFDKFIDTWRIEETGHCEIQKPSTAKDPKKKYRTNLYLGSKRAWLEETRDLVNKHKSALNEKLVKAVAKQEELVKALCGKCIPVKTDWRFVSGLGSGHPFETGFIWHRTLGVPYLPGSSVKGLMRAWADPKKGWGDEITWERIKRLFCDTKDDGAGSLIVFDALPIQVPDLELDIMNPHYAEYYSKELYEKPDGSTELIPPADYLSPTPIFFLAIAGEHRFCFALAPRRPKDENAADDLKEGLELLQQARATLGAGGKTAVGYGSMTYDPSAQPPDSLAEFKSWFEAQKFGAANKGRHSEIIDRL